MEQLVPVDQMETQVKLVLQDRQVQKVKLVLLDLLAWLASLAQQVLEARREKKVLLVIPDRQAIKVSKV